MKCLIACLGVVSLVSCHLSSLNAQSFTVKPGKWSTPSTWSDGVVPDHTTSSITIYHAVRIPADTSLILDEVFVQDTLTIESHSSLTLNNAQGSLADLQITTGFLKVYGRLICHDGATLSGTSVANTVFQNGSTYEHQYSTTAGEPPLAAWNKNATLEITGYTNSRSLNTSGWQQAFGNVVYDCPGQLSFVEMLGNVRNIQGNFHIRNTHDGVLRVSLDQTTPTAINIGGDLIIEGKSTVWFGRGSNITLNIGGNFEYHSTELASSYLTTTGSCQVNVAGDLRMNSVGTLRFASSGGGTGTLRIKKDLIFQAGTMDAEPVGQGVVECNGSGMQTASLQGNIPFGLKFIVNNAAGVSLSTGSVFGGDIRVRSGATLLFDSDISLPGNVSVESGAFLLPQEKALRLTGSADQILDLSGNTLHHLHINKSAGTSVTFGSLANVSGTLLVQSTNTTLVSNGNLTLLSVNDDGDDDASLATLPNGSSIQGDVTVQRYMHGEGRAYRYIASPVNTATVASLLDDFPITGTFDDPSTGTGIRSGYPSFFYYDETLDEEHGWINYPGNGSASASPLVPGRGYAAFIREAVAPTAWDVTGPVNQGEIDLNVTYTDHRDPLNDGWNLVGNPYPSSIDWDVPNGWRKTNIKNEIAVRDNALGIFLYWDGSVGSLGSGKIAKGQAFWIQTRAANPVLKVNENAKTTTTEFHRIASREPDYLEIVMQGIGVIDKTYLRLRDGAVTGYDSLDIPKLDNEFLNLSLTADNIPLAIASSGTLDCSTPVRLHIDFIKTADGSFARSPLGEYKLSIQKFGLFSRNKIRLHDAFTGQWSDAKEYSFTITDDPASLRKDRFELWQETTVVPETLSVIRDEVVCDSAAYSIQLKNAQPGVLYTVNIDHRAVLQKLNIDESTIELRIDPSLFSQDTTLIVLTSTNICFRKELMFNVPRFREPVITEKNGALHSPYKTGNQWYYEGIKIENGATPAYSPERSGNYSLKVRMNNCEATASYDYIHQNEAVQCYPNPVERVITFISPRGQSIVGIEIMSPSSQVIQRHSLDANHQKKEVLSLHDLPPGLYLVEVSTEKITQHFRIMKK